MEEGVGLYIHIPYCVSKCRYCAFASAPGAPSTAFAQALSKELDLLGPGRISTLHAGGGTPTRMKTGFWKELLGRMDLSGCREAAIETNPAVLAGNGYAELARAGFNRISIGVQSFNPEHLEFLGRIHTPEQAVESVKAARAGGFTNLSLDLIYGLPDQTVKQWRSDLERALSLRPDHISCYELTLEPGTPLGELGRKAPEARCAGMFMAAHEILSREGFHHYEVSNFALPGFESRHNSAYWSRRPYAGAGPSAHGFTGGTRYWNTPDTARYISLMERNILPREGEEEITPAMAHREEVMLGLRTSRGVREGIVPRAKMETFIKKGWLERDGGFVKPTPEGMLWADGMAAELAD